MKRIGTIVSLALLIVLISCSACFAAGNGLELVKSYPEDGKGGLQPAGVAMKLYFNEDISADKIQKSNKASMKLVDKNNKEIPLKLLHTPSKPKDLLVIVNKDLEADSSYTFTLSDDFQASNGDKLKTPVEINFETRNIKTDTNVSMIFMVVMVVAMIFFSSRAMRKQVAKENEAKHKEDKVNPYKVSKETGKPVEEIVAKTQKEKEKAQAKAQKNQGSVHKAGSPDHSRSDSDAKRVTGPKPIAASGSTYKTGRKAAAEKAKAEAARRATTNPKNATGKSKNKKGKK